jgi:succinyl-diaminopimelate desuccinylase
MNGEIIFKIDELIDNIDDELASDIIRFVNIKSTQGKSISGAPFGEGPKKMLDEFIKVATEDGLFCVDYNVGVVSAALKEGDIDLGIWLHGDVVEAGGDWSFEPYNAVRYKDYVIILSANKKSQTLG